MDIQKERKVHVWQTMYELVRDYDAADLYSKAFNDRMKQSETEKLARMSAAGETTGFNAEVEIRSVKKGKSIAD